jgi:hypothetical protein
MAPRWWPFKGGRRADPFTRATLRDLDIAMPPRYDTFDDAHGSNRANVEGRIGRLQPNGIDSGSREVLNNLINALADQAAARLDGGRDDRQAVGEVLIGLARQQAARRKPRYDADLTRAWLAYGALRETGYFIALLVTAGADLAVFDQVVSLVLGMLQPWVVWLTVAGFTAGSLALAHFIGRLLRDQAGGDGPGGRTAVWLLVIPWLLLGVVAFAVRWLVAEDQGSVSTTAVGGTDPRIVQLSGAIMFLALYLASGAVAGFGEYLTRNPYRARYRTALRRYHRSLRRLRRSQPRYERTLSALQLHTRGRARERLNHQAAVDLQLAFADELKRHAAFLMAAHLQDPAATDGMTLPDRRPFAGPVTPPDHGDQTDKNRTDKNRGDQ